MRLRHYRMLQTFHFVWNFQNTVFSVGWKRRKDPKISFSKLISYGRRVQQIQEEANKSMKSLWDKRRDK